jgi:hypothetical protein
MSVLEGDIGDLAGSIGLSDLFYNPAKDRKKGGQGAEAGMEAYADLEPSKFQDVNLQGPNEARDVQYNPATFSGMEAVNQGPSAYNDINVNPALREAQMGQLAALQELRDSGGLSAQNQADLSQIQNEQNQNERSQRMAILQNARQRGMGGSGQEMMAQLAAQQGAATRANEGGLGVAAQAENNRFNAGQAAAGLAGGMEQQQYGQAAQKAAAQDAIARFNAQNSTGANQTNAQMRNQMGMYNAGQGLGAQEFNVGKSQGVNNAAAAAQNQNQLMNKYYMPQTTFQQQATRAGGLAGAGKTQAGYYGDQSQQKTENQQGLLSGGVEMGTKAAPSIMAAFADRGGEIPGRAPVSGDSLRNDGVPIQASPGEVVVPRSLTQASPAVISKFVKHPPSVLAPEKKKAAMLAALKHMRGH